MTENLQVLKDNIRVLLKLEFGMNLNLENDWDFLWYLCENNKKELIKDLIENGGDTNVEDFDGDSVLWWAPLYWDDKIIEILQKEENNKSQ